MFLSIASFLLPSSLSSLLHFLPPACLPARPPFFFFFFFLFKWGSYEFKKYLQPRVLKTNCLSSSFQMPAFALRGLAWSSLGSACPQNRKKEVVGNTNADCFRLTKSVRWETGGEYLQLLQIALVWPNQEGGRLVASTYSCCCVFCC